MQAHDLDFKVRFNHTLVHENRREPCLRYMDSDKEEVFCDQLNLNLTVP